MLTTLRIYRSSSFSFIGIEVVFVGTDKSQKISCVNFSSAVLFGDKHSLGEETTRILRLCGLSHISVVSGLDAIVDKVLDEVTDATVTDTNGNAYELLSGGSFYIAEEANKFGAIVKAIKRIVDSKLLENTIHK